jgi:hypothetical protein
MTNTTLISNLTSRTKTKNWLESYNSCGVSGYASDMLYRYIIFECSDFTFEGIKREFGDHADSLIDSLPSESGSHVTDSTIQHLQLFAKELI